MTLASGTGSASGLRDRRSSHVKLKGQNYEEAMRDLLAKRQQQIVQQQVQAQMEKMGAMNNSNVVDITCQDFENNVRRVTTKIFDDLKKQQRLNPS